MGDDSADVPLRAMSGSIRGTAGAAGEFAGSLALLGRVSSGAESLYAALGAAVAVQGPDGRVVFQNAAHLGMIGNHG